MISSKPELQLILGRLAEHFEREAQYIGGIGRGWGQFLDAPKNHAQIGPYGTCAGIITLNLAGRGDTPVCREAAHLISSWWMERSSTDYEKQRFAQNLRLAFLNLAVRLSNLPELRAIQPDIEAAMLGRCLSSGGWGDWWQSEDNYDPAPSTFTSSICMLSLLLFRGDLLSDETLPLLGKVASTLRDALHARSRLSELEIVGAISAVCAWDSYKARVDGARMATSPSWASSPPQRHGNYFFFYEYAPDAQGKSFGRDYLLVPIDLLIAVGGFQHVSRAATKLSAEDVLSRTIRTLDANEGLYRIAKREHISTIDQSWVAIVIASAIKHAEEGATPPGKIARFWYELRKDREDNAFTDTLSIIVVLFLTIVNAQPWNDSVTLKIFISVGTVLAAALYGDNILRRLLRGRQ